METILSSESERFTEERFNTLLRNESLLESEPTLRGINFDAVSQSGGSIYYGTGLTTPRTLSIGLPFDVLAMTLTAEKLRRSLGLKGIIHHIADTHALANPFATEDAVDALALTVERTMASVAAHLKIPEFHIIRSSSFDGTPQYSALLAGIHSEKGDYVRRELADMRWYREQHGLALKIGWIIQSSETTEGFDERLYDNEYRRLFGTDLSFVYLKAGRTFDKRRPKASPYIAVPDEQRILLRAGEPVQEKIDRALSLWPEKTLGGALNHLNSIVRLYDRLVEPTGRGTLAEKISVILSRIFS